MSVSPCPADPPGRPADLWKDQVVYQVMVDRFASPDGDGNLPDRRGPYVRQGGTIPGLIKKLPYLKELGITALLLNPVTTSDSYHGYSVTDLMSIEPAIGGEAAYRELVQRCHELGIKVLFDLVLNHASADSELFKSHPKWFRGLAKPTAINDPLIPQAWSKVTFFYLRDLRQEDEAVYQYLLTAATKWADLGIDGFRMDAVTLIQPEFWRRFNADLRTRVKKEFLIVGEIFDEAMPDVNPYLPDFDGFLDFPTWRLLSRTAKSIDDGIDLVNWSLIERSYSNPAALPFRFVDNHDVSRIANDFPDAEREQRAKVALGVLFQIPGVPTLLYGTEIGLRNDPRAAESLYDRSRSRMIFRNNEEQPIYRFLKHLIEVRKSFDFNGCERIVISSPPGVFASFLRDGRGRTLFTVVNPSSRPYVGVRFNLNFYQLMPKRGTFRDLLTDAQPASFKDGYVTVDIPAFGTAYYELAAAA